MRTKITCGGLLFAAILTIAAACSPATPMAPSATAQPTETPPSAEPEIIATYTLPDLPLRSFQNEVLPGSIAIDRRLFVGGLSDLWRGASDSPNDFWVVTDRGPSKEIVVRVTNEDRMTFAIPEFNPMILRVQVQGQMVEVLEAIPIVTQTGGPVTGLPNIEGYDTVAFDYLGQSKLAVHPNGLNTQGLVRGVGGDFWLVDEYSPSLVHLDRTGRVLTRYVPQGLVLNGADYAVVPVLPAILTNRKSDRGFDGLALSDNEKMLYMVVESPLRNPDRKTGDASRIVRVLAFDVASEKVSAEYAYRLDVSTEFDLKNHPPASAMGLSAIVSIGPTTLLVVERTDEVAKAYRVDLSQATNILGSKWDDAATAPSLESLDDPASSGVRVLPKSLVIDLSQLAGMPPKIEGAAVIDQNTIAVVNDNGYDVLGFAFGSNVPLGQKTKIMIIRLGKPLR